jgi:RNA polymerase sigma-54 factor
MAYELKQELRLTQSLVMTPQLQLAIRLLQLSRLELVDMIKEEVQANPLLEVTADADTEAQSGAVEDPSRQQKDAGEDWERYIEGLDGGRRGLVDFNARSEDDEADPLSNAVSQKGVSLREHLMWQLNMSGLPPELMPVGEFIIGNIDEDGYLRVVDGPGADEAGNEDATVKEIAGHTGASEEDVLEVLDAIQHFDPLAAGARNLRECLLIQARSLPVRDTVAEEIISSHLERLAARNFKAIAKGLGISVADVSEAASFINRRLNPTPGRGFGKEDRAYVVPDIFIHKVGDEYVITMNEDGLPKFKISRYYRELLKTNGVPDEARSYIQERFRSALWLIKSMHQRQRTIYRVVECIVKFQREFLDKGLKHLRPLVLKDVASEIGVHESTVSRVTSNKYVQTPRGIFELKYFFSSGLSSSEGDSLATEYIRERVRDIIKAEDARNPLSDKQIVDKLKETGIVVARRTAAKYRESLGFPSSNRRKSHY